MCDCGNDHYLDRVGCSKRKLIAPDPPPRYNEVFEEGVRAMDDLHDCKWAENRIEELEDALRRIKNFLYTYTPETREMEEQIEAAEKALKDKR